MKRAPFYALIGWCMEILFTGIVDTWRTGDVRLVATTYLWMGPIYAAGGLLLEAFHAAFRDPPWTRAPLLVRSLVYLVVIYAVELTFGVALRQILGRCPWDYGDRGWNVGGLVRLDYAPLWFVVGLSFETIEKHLRACIDGGQHG